MSGYLELADGGFIGVRDGLVLGRVSACDVVVNDTKASRRHARLIVESGVVEIEDMKSSNGTLLNGKPVDRRLMRDGDEVRIGKTVIIYREGSLPGAKSSSRKSGGAAAVFEDDDDLFGDSPSSASTIADEPRPTPANATPPKTSPPTPKPEPVKPEPVKPEPPKPAAASGGDLLGDDDLLGGEDDLLGGDDDLAASPPPPAAPPAAPSNVVEFEDEVVEVEQAPAPKRRDPEPVRRPQEPVIEVRKSQPTSSSKKPVGGADEVVGTSGRVLQYSKKSSGKNPLGDDLGQMSGGMRLLVVLAGLAIGGGIIYGILIAMK